MCKNLLLITKVKNEADIIESFIRYHLSLFDEIVVIDNGSLDGTDRIVNSVAEEKGNIEFINEAFSDFDELRLVNQYTFHFIKKYSADIVVFMDADEFLVADGGKSPREVLCQLSDEKIYYCKWKTYIHQKDHEIFKFEDYPEYRDESMETFTKVIVPANILTDKEVLITAGNHSFKSVNEIDTEYCPELKFCHFPIRSMVQYKKQILLNSIDLISCPNEKKHSSTHWKKMFSDNNDYINLREISLHYAFYEGNNVKREEKAFILDIELKYTDLIQNDLEKILIKHAEIQALRLKKERLKKCTVHYDAESIIVYGTGWYADKMVDRIDRNHYRIEAFADSNIEKEFNIYKNKIIVSPDKLRFIKFDKIVIATEQYVDEMKDTVKMELPFLTEEKVITIEQLLLEQYSKNMGI